MSARRPPARRPARRGPARRSLLGTRPGAAPSRPASPVRARTERGLGAPIVYLSSLPRWLPFAVVVGLGVVAVIVEGVVGAVLLGVLAALLAVLAYVSWPAVPASGRLLRVAAVGAIVVAAVVMAGR